MHHAAREVRRMKITTKQLNPWKYARCEWKCMEWIGTDNSGKICNEAIRRDTIHRVSPKRQKPVPIHSIHCNGQRGDYLIGNDPRRPKF